jgi:hypothetical protein
MRTSNDGTGLSSNDVHGQRYGVDGTMVGDTFAITSGQTDADASSTAGLLDGRFVVAHTQHDGADVDIRARVFDTNNAIDPVIERDAGGPRRGRFLTTSSMAAIARIFCMAGSATIY